MGPSRTSFSPEASLIARLCVLAGLSLAAFGQMRLLALDRVPGDPFPWVPALLLLIGAALFALGYRLAPRAGPAEERAFGTAAPDPASLRGRAPWFVAALILSAACAIAYAFDGYHPLILIAWISTLGLATWGLWPLRRSASFWHRLRPGEIGGLALIILAAAGLLLPYLAAMPYTISTDEIYLILTVESFMDGSQQDPLGLVSWWGFPALYFAVVAEYAGLVGTSVEAMRLISALTGLAILVPFYLWIRTLHGTRVAVVALVLLAFGHAFIGWGRLALHVNSSMLALVLALAVLAPAMRDGCPLKFLWGGILLGLGFYTYPSSQIGIVIWVAFLGLILLTRRFPARTVVVLGLLSALGFLLAAAPMLVNAIGEFETFTERARAIAIDNPAVVQTLAERWGLTGADAVFRENLTRGLLTFNAPLPYVNYFNPRHGLADPMIGVLLWCGLALALVRPRHAGLLLAVIGFALIWGPNLFTEDAPAHSRVLIALPLVAAMCAEVLVQAARVLSGGSRIGRRASTGMLAAAAVAFVVLNLSIYRDFVRNQRSTGHNDALAAIARTLDAKLETGNPIERFFGQAGGWSDRDRVLLVTSAEHPVFRWGEPRQWKEWVAFFVGSRNFRLDENLDALLGEDPLPYRGFWNRLVVIMTSDLWRAERSRLLERYPELRRSTITPNRRITAIEILR